MMISLLHCGNALIGDARFDVYDNELCSSLCCSVIDGIVKYMRSKAGPSSKKLLSEAEVGKFLASDDHSILGNVLVVPCIN